MKTAKDIVVDIHELRICYGSVDVLQDVTFQVRSGEVLALLGPNGAGKSTTIEILEGFRMRSAGRVQVLGTDPAHGTEQWRARLGIVLQSWRDHGKWRVRELLTQLGAYYACYSSELIRRPWDIDELIAAVGLTGQANKKIKTLSGGQRRRLDVAIGLIGRPELLFLDEPTSGLDPQARHEFHELMQGLAQQGETSILLTTHDLNEAEKLANRILLLNHGTIIADGTAAELAQRIVGEDEVRWTRGGQHFTRLTHQSTKFIFELFQQYGETIEDIEVRRSSLEDTYLQLIHQTESKHSMEAYGLKEAIQ